MKKFIFLDFDGVITTEKSRYKLDKEKIDLLGEILEATGAKIVVSSSWRFNTVEDTKKDLTTISHRVPFEFPYADDIVGVTPRGYHYTRDLDDGKRFHIPRGVEIENWLDGNTEYGEDYNYVILDDDSDMLLTQKDHFVKTDPYKGMNRKNVEKAIRILNS